MQIVTARVVFAALAIFVYIFFKDKKLLKIDIHDYFYFIGTGIISVVVFNWCYFTAVNITSLSVAAILLYTAPAFVMIFSSILFKEKLTKRKMAALFLTFTGCAFVTVFVKDAGQNISIVGILAGLGSGLGYALYSIFGRYALKKYDPVTVTFYTFVFASVSLLPVNDIGEFVRAFSDTGVIFYTVLLGMLATVLPFLLYTKALTCLETSKASIIATLEPVVATVIGIVLYGEPVTVYKLLGIGMVIFAVSILAEENDKTCTET
jgi:drug/metabolite transporter (DMT)-like permease